MHKNETSKTPPQIRICIIIKINYVGSMTKQARSEQRHALAGYPCTLNLDFPLGAPTLPFERGWCIFGRF